MRHSNLFREIYAPPLLFAFSHSLFKTVCGFTTKYWY